MSWVASKDRNLLLWVWRLKTSRGGGLAALPPRALGEKLSLPLQRLRRPAVLDLGPLYPFLSLSSRGFSPRRLVFCLSLPLLLQGYLSLDLGPPHLGWCHLEIPNLITASKSLYPNKSHICRFPWVGRGHIWGREGFNPHR